MYKLTLAWLHHGFIEERSEEFATFENAHSAARFFLDANPCDAYAFINGEEIK